MFVSQIKPHDISNKHCHFAELYIFFNKNIASVNLAFLILMNRSFLGKSGIIRYFYK